MKKVIVKAIQILALLMLIGGVFMFFVCRYEAWDSEIRSYYSKDSSSVVMWQLLSVQCILTAISSIFVFGFSYIVEAACLYIEKVKQEKEMAIEESE